jgi:DNA-binding MarR family transcriptional regulator
MSNDTYGFELPLLLFGGFRSIIDELHAELARRGHQDMRPAHGFAMQAIGFSGATATEVGRRLGISKQAAGQLVDTLVVRGYLERAPDPEDRRRLTLTLTEVGQLAAAASRSAVERVDAELVARVGPEHVSRTRATLAALIDLGDEPGETPEPRSSP